MGYNPSPRQSTTSGAPGKLLNEPTTVPRGPVAATAIMSPHQAPAAAYPPHVPYYYHPTTRTKETTHALPPPPPAPPAYVSPPSPQPQHMPQPPPSHWPPTQPTGSPGQVARRTHWTPAYHSPIRLSPMGAQPTPLQQQHHQQPPPPPLPSRQLYTFRPPMVSPVVPAKRRPAESPPTPHHHHQPTPEPVYRRAALNLPDPVSMPMPVPTGGKGLGSKRPLQLAPAQTANQGGIHAPYRSVRPKPRPSPPVASPTVTTITTTTAPTAIARSGSSIPPRTIAARPLKPVPATRTAPAHTPNPPPSTAPWPAAVSSLKTTATTTTTAPVGSATSSARPRSNKFSIDFLLRKEVAVPADSFRARPRPPPPPPAAAPIMSSLSSTAVAPAVPASSRTQRSPPPPSPTSSSFPQRPPSLLPVAVSATLQKVDPLIPTKLATAQVPPPASSSGVPTPTPPTPRITLQFDSSTAVPNPATAPTTSSSNTFKSFADISSSSNASFHFSIQSTFKVPPQPSALRPPTLALESTSPSTPTLVSTYTPSIPQTHAQSPISRGDPVASRLIGLTGSRWSNPMTPSSPITTFQPSFSLSASSSSSLSAKRVKLDITNSSPETDRFGDFNIDQQLEDIADFLEKDVDLLSSVRTSK
ncbi:hypothetical protein BJ085DRAFT_36636 [Dimargaris cristalligena]|uniref:Uncharacterized protein n=1 Tax=Dimargaris cristalligena TaxID=215637 RepID=A0A4P9ZXP4_9FUNG|nr:hypothetical protein BJ085DRAFT_36636 [Dimargaris cristalligena]|eukprot:RKP38485.1 hypothetical protein BJ085DRAFT_36636 [Dimargaris cristalligena]